MEPELPRYALLRKRKTLQTIAAVTIVLLTALILYSLHQFINATLGAVLVYVLAKPLMNYLTEKKKWGANLSAITIIVITFLIILLPLWGIASLLIPKLTIFFSDTSYLLKMVNELDLQFKSFTGQPLFSADNLKNIQQNSTAAITGLVSGGLNALGQVVIMYFILYFLLINVNKIESFMMAYIPMSKKNIQRFSQELKAQTVSNAIGSPLLALFQGIIASIGFWIFGLTQPVFWGMMAGIFSFIPFVGSAIIWLPAAIVQITNGFHWQGIAIILYGLFVISTVDNVFRFVFQKKFADVHPMITVFGIIMGLQLFNLPGFIFGPLLISWLLIMLRIYKEEYLETLQEHDDEIPGTP